MNKREKLICASDSLDEMVHFILKTSGETVPSFAEFVGVSKAYVYAILCGKRRATLEFATKLYQLTKLNDNELDMLLDMLVTLDTQVLCMGTKIDTKINEDMCNQVKLEMTKKIKEGILND